MRTHLKTVVWTLVLIASAAFADNIPVPAVCVVSGDRFADHNHPPIMVTAQGKTIAVCCKGCERKFQKDPAKYIQLYEAAIKAPASAP